MKAPCHGCEDRIVGCHSGCAKYKEYKEELENRKATLKVEHEIDNYLIRKAAERKIRRTKKNR